MLTTPSTRSYQRATCIPVVSSGNIRSPFWVVRDAPTWESFSERDLPEYAKRSSVIFLDRFTQFMYSPEAHDQHEAHELREMLDALINVRPYY